MQWVIWYAVLSMMMKYQLLAVLKIRPEPIMLFKLPIMLLSNAPKFSLLCPNYAPLCPIMLHKMLLPEYED